MAAQVYQNIYQQEIPLPNNPLKAVNSFFILSKERSLIIDTGFNHEEGRKIMLQTIEELQIDLSKTDLVLTHLHSDHCGLAAFLKEKGAKVYMSQSDGDYMNRMFEGDYQRAFQEKAKLMGLEADQIHFSDHPGYAYAPAGHVDFHPLKEGQIFIYGDYQFQVVNVPGHTPGHIALYEPVHQLFFGGDHVLNRITPNITFWDFQISSLADYLVSLKKVYNLEIKVLFSAHRARVEQHRQRIEELIAHHVHRLAEITEILGETKKSVREVAAKMHWELRYDNWEDFPSPQKWFASGEAMAHLEYLVGIGKAERHLDDGVARYQLIGQPD